MNVEINMLEILAAGVASMALGFFWYSPMVLGKQWMKEKGLTQESVKKAQKEMGKLYALSFAVSLITAFVLFNVMTLSQSVSHYPILKVGFSSAFWMWVGFIMPVQLTAAIFGNKNWKLLGIDTGYQLVSVVAMAVVIALL